MAREALPRGLRPVRSPMNPVLKIDQPILQPFVILPPSLRPLPEPRFVQRVVTRPQQIGGQAAEQRGEPFLLPSPGCLSHTATRVPHPAGGVRLGSMFSWLK